VNETRLLARLLAETRHEHLPGDVVRRAKDSIGDTIACGLGGRATREGDTLLGIMGSLGGRQEATVIGDKQRLPFLQAAQVNRVTCNMLDYDDTSIKAGHMSSALVPAVLAIGEHLGSSGKDMITALVLGYETISRIKDAAYPSEEAFWTTFERIDTGIHFGITVAAAKLFGLDAEQTASALGLAGYMRSWRITFPDVPRRGMPPWMKVTGGDIIVPAVHAALLAEKGFPGDETILDQESGYAASVGSDRYDASLLTKGWGKEYGTLRIGYKYYSACRFTSAALDGVAAIMDETRLKVDDIAEVLVKVQKGVAQAFAIYEPRYMIQAEFSIPYVVSMVLLGEPTGPNWYSERMLKDRRVRDLQRLVKVGEAAGAAQAFYAEAKVISAVEITTKGGERYSRHVEFPKGEPENPFTTEDHADKLTRMASLAGLRQNRIDELLHTLDDLENMTTVRDLGRLLGP
jgi:2-methylcitrate dehydratase PrpD